MEASNSPAWEVPVVVFLVWTLVLAVSTLIVLSCLRRETRRFSKRVSKPGGTRQEEEVEGLEELDALMGEYVACKLAKGVLDRLSAAFSPTSDSTHEEGLRQQVLAWFRQRVAELRGRGLAEKGIKRTLLAAVRTGLSRHPLDLRGSRRSLEAAQLLLTLERPGGHHLRDRLSTTLPRKAKGGGLFLGMSPQVREARR